jgi:branched-chain amino acid transport system substrate-binding protein
MGAGAEGGCMMRSLVWRMLVIAIVAQTGCSLVLNFHECNQDSDCARISVDGGPAGYCTSDHACVAGLPDERLCGEPHGAPAGPGTVTFAGLARLDGPSSPKDEQRMNAVRLAADEVYQLRQLPIRLVLCNTSGDSAQAIRALQVAVSRFSAVAVIGPTDSPDLLALAASLRQTGTLAVTGAATAIAITNLVDDNLIWRTVPSDRLQAPVMASMVPATATAIEVVYADTVYGNGLEQAFTAALYGIRMLSAVNSIVFPQGAAQATTVMRMAKDSPAVAVIIADTDVPALVTALGSGGPSLAATQFIMPAAAKSPALLQATSDLMLLSRVRGTGTGFPSTPVTLGFVQRFSAAFQSDPASASGTANFYDAFYAVAIATAAVPAGQTITGRALARAMTRLSTKGAAQIAVGPNDYTKGRLELSAGRDIDLLGASGDIDFDPNTGDVLTGPIELWSIDVSTNPPSFRTDSIVTPSQ